MALPHFRIRAIRTIYHLYHDSDSRDESGPASQASGTAVAVACNRMCDGADSFGLIIWLSAVAFPLSGDER